MLARGRNYFLIPSKIFFTACSRVLRWLSSLEDDGGLSDAPMNVSWLGICSVVSCVLQSVEADFASLSNRSDTLLAKSFARASGLIARFLLFRLTGNFLGRLGVLFNILILFYKQTFFCETDVTPDALQHKYSRSWHSQTFSFFRFVRLMTTSPGISDLSASEI